MVALIGNIVDVVNGSIYPGAVYIEGEHISKVERLDDKFSDFILPGFVDAHIHIESSMLTPSRFAEAVVPHGTVAVVADPHEIANVMGIEGIEYMRSDAAKTPLRLFLTAPSCVPATDKETSGAELGMAEIAELLSWEDVVALGEVMNYPGVIAREPEVMGKIDEAKKRGKPADGHCPGLTGDALRRYVGAGISTDHECTTLAEAQEKLRAGMKIMIREGSSAKDLEALASIDGEAFFVSDDKHAADLADGHMDAILRRAVALGVEPMEAVRRTTLYPVRHYRLNVGLLRKGDPADVVVADGLEKFRIKETWIRGKRVAAEGIALFSSEPDVPRSSFRLAELKPEDFAIVALESPKKARVIEVVDGQITTRANEAELEVRDGFVVGDIGKDVLKIAVAERYGGGRLAKAFVKGLGLDRGALASSVAHDSHNIVAVGTNDRDISVAVNAIAAMQGGLVTTYNGKILASLPLPVAGLMSIKRAKEVAEEAKNLHRTARALGCELSSPFTTLSFTTLLVIPELRLSDRGLFDVAKFEFVDLFLD